MNLKKEIEKVLAEGDPDDTPYKFETVDKGRTLKLLKRETGEMMASFTICAEGITFDDMSVEQLLTIVFSQMNETNKIDPSPENPAMLVSMIELPPAE